MAGRIWWEQRDVGSIGFVNMVSRLTSRSARFALLYSVAVLGQTAAACGAMIPIGSFDAENVMNPASGHELDATAEFVWDSTNGLLIITVTNTSTSDYSGAGNKLVPSDVLTGFFFDVTPQQSLSQGTPFAVVGPSSTVINGTGGPGTDVTAPPAGPTLGGWAYTFVDSNTISQDQGFGTAGFDIFPGKYVNGKKMHGFAYGIVNSNYDPGEGNGGIEGTPLVSNSIIFTLSGLTQPVVVSNVRFQYGTDLEEPFMTASTLGPNPPVPLPSSLVLLGSGIVGCAGLRRFRCNRSAAC